MTLYLPIMKAKPGELESFGCLAPSVASSALPIFEIQSPSGTSTLERTLEVTAAKIVKYVPAKTLLALDWSAVGGAGAPAPTTAQSVAEWMSDRLLTHGILVMPVARVSDDSADRAAVAKVVASQGQGVVVRLGGESGDPSTATLHRDVSGLLNDLGLRCSSATLVLDMWAVEDSREVGRAQHLATALLSTVHALGPWRDVVLASGAFPTSISDLAKGAPSSLPRWDADLWMRVRATDSSLGFGDYCVNSPRTGVGRRPLPNLRYTSASTWLVWRESNTRPGNESFYDLCKRVVVHQSWCQPQFSWGDGRIEECAREIRGAGTATQWRAYGTNHHITAVVDRLAKHGVP